MKKFLTSLLLALACCMPAAAQMNVNDVTYTYGTVTGDNTYNCSPTGLNKNCFHLSGPVAATLFSSSVPSPIATGIDKYAVALDTAGHFYDYAEFPVGYWTEHTTWGTGHGVAVGDANHIYSLQGLYPGHTADRYIEILNTTNDTWSSVAGGAAVQISAKSSTLMAVSQYHCGYVSQNGGGWAGLPGGCVWNYVSPLSQGLTNFVGIQTNNEAYYYDGSVLHDLHGSGIAIEGNLEGDLYIIGVGGNLGSVFHGVLYNILNNIGAYWTPLTGNNFTGLATGGSGSNWFIGPNSGGFNVYRYSDQYAGEEITATEPSIYCGPGSCPATHSLNMSADIKLGDGQENTGHTGGNLAQWSGNPVNSFNKSSVDIQHDLFDCLDDPEGCTFSVGQNPTAECTQIGPLANPVDGGPLPMCPPSNRCCGPNNGCSIFCPEHCPPPPVVPPAPPKPKPAPIPIPPPCQGHCRK